MTEQVVTVDGVELCLETFGDPADAAVLLISGAAMSMDWWEVGFCEALAGERRYVIRYDHRDTGRSTASPAGHPSYTFNDLDDDALRVLDAVGIESAHVVGLSMGGGIAQTLAVQHGDRVRSLTLISTSCAGSRASAHPLPSMTPRLVSLFEQPPPEPDWADRAAVIDYVVEGNRPFAGSLGLDEERTRRLAGQVVDRTRDMAASMQNHWILDGESVEFPMAAIKVSTLVLHGTDDPMFPVEHGEALAAEIPGARFVALPGMGHEVPPAQLWSTVVTVIAEHSATA